ncbi:methyltransferase domain-containing protein [Lentzea sp. NPDC051838]|uniref:class I SAM-dependent methyltransferase n=1 Tax=Lentzea sp. NPDC051838 TaxID=3154849 RepID=UPI00342F1223
MANPLLMREVERLRPGSALDLGCAGGGDAVWLARRGWRVSSVEQRDLPEKFPDGEFDLISARFLHSHPDRSRASCRILKRATEAVAAGGYLVIIGHAETPSWSEHLDCDFPTTKNVLDSLKLMDNWIIITNEVVRREVTGPKGLVETCADNVLTLKRLL